jgi:uncharacterized protein (DUF1778 family)
VNEAAEYGGITLSSWILTAALREARAVIADKAAMAAGKEQRLALVKKGGSKKEPRAILVPND